MFGSAIFFRLRVGRLSGSGKVKLKLLRFVVNLSPSCGIYFQLRSVVNKVAFVILSLLWPNSKTVRDLILTGSLLFVPGGGATKLDLGGQKGQQSNIIEK